MPLQNRVDPWGQLHLHPTRNSERMGNRGILHDESQTIIRPWSHKGWVQCLLHFGNMKRPKIFGPGTYSELFFLDEATAFSAGHRPCAFCQRARFDEFKSHWVSANRTEGSFVGVKEIDLQLHMERTIRGGGKLTFRAPLSSLPDGTFVERNGKSELIWNREVRTWSWDGYGSPMPLNAAEEVVVLTPPSLVRTFANGFRPEVYGHLR